MKYKIGDELKVLNQSLCGIFESSYLVDKGSYIRVQRVFDTSYNYDILNSKGQVMASCNCYLQDKDLQLKTNKQNIMQKLNSMLKRLLDADAQALFKAGFINGNLELTKEGLDALISILFDKNKQELVKFAQERIAEEEK